MAYTLTQLQELRNAIAEGVLSVRFSDGRQLTYRSLDEMRRIEAVMAAELESGSTPRLRRTYLRMSRPT
ncbi:MAG: phage head-tail joining protein [Cyanobacteriota bacterium]|jgi:roadblock/LC7 domain-containing protein